MTGPLMVDMTEFYHALGELFERFDMAPDVAVGLEDVAEFETWAALLYNGWSEALCQHMAATAADIVHRRYPAAASMPLDHRFNLCLASMQPPFEFSYPGEHLELAKRVVGDHLRDQAQDSYGIGTDSSSIDPLYKPVKSVFEVAIAVISIAQAHPLYQHDEP
ncbi:MAG: hypothetical protein J2P17_30120 [Mycobacterium sp.]|nr:hypothetical protein [Mycobacterium sp.]